MTDFACMPGTNRSRMITIAAVTQDAIDLAGVGDVHSPCILLSLCRLKENGPLPGCVMTLEQAQVLAVGLLTTTASAHRDERRALPEDAPPAKDLPIDLIGCVQSLRRHWSLSQAKLAARAGCCVRTVAGLEMHEHVPDDATLRKIASALRVEPGFLIGLAKQARTARRQQRAADKGSQSCA